MCLVNIAVWCSGNTSDFDSDVVGSNPATAANHIKPKCKLTSLLK